MHHLVQKIRTSRGNTFWNTLLTRRFSLPTYRYDVHIRQFTGPERAPTFCMMCVWGDVCVWGCLSVYIHTYTYVRT